MTSRYHYLCEDYLRNSSIPLVVILRPGGLANHDRNISTTHLQVDPSGSLPPPGRVPRSDVAALAVAACDPSVLTVPMENTSHHSTSNRIRWTLAVRAVGEDIQPRPQGTKQDGYATARECLQALVPTDTSSLASTRRQPSSKPYGVAVGLFVYGLLGISLTVLKILFLNLWKLLAA